MVSELKTAAHCPGGGQRLAAFLRDQCWGWHCVTPLLVTRTVGLSATSGEGVRRKSWKGLEQDNF